MSEDKQCPKVAKCPIFNGVLKGTEYTETYKNLYCLGGPEGRGRCKRFLIAEKVGFCPPNVLPNAFKSVDEIIAEMKERGELS